MTVESYVGSSSTASFSPIGEGVSGSLPRPKRPGHQSDQKGQEALRGLKGLRINSQAMDTKQQVVVVKDGGWGAQQKQHQIDEPQDKDHGQLSNAADVQEDRAGQETQQHVPNEVLRGQRQRRCWMK